ENSYSKSQLYDYAKQINQALNRDCMAARRVRR
ncbi:hypothetical protein, partial [Salmonella enterica]